MRSRMSAKPVEVVRLNGGGAGCHDRFYSRRPVGGEVFLLTSPFIEPTSRDLCSLLRVTDNPSKWFRKQWRRYSRVIVPPSFSTSEKRLLGLYAIRAKSTPKYEAFRLEQTRERLQRA